LIATPLATTTSGLDVWHLVMDAGPMAKLVLLVLLGFSVASWGIMAERFRRFRRAEEETRSFLGRFRKGGGLAAIEDETKVLRWSPVAGIYRAAFREISLNPPPDHDRLSGDSLDAIDRVLRKNASVQLAELASRPTRRESPRRSSPRRPVLSRRFRPSSATTISWAVCARWIW
jgi:biopolymer transport protein TolQ